MSFLVGYFLPSLDLLEFMLEAIYHYNDESDPVAYSLARRILGPLEIRKHKNIPNKVYWIPSTYEIDARIRRADLVITVKSVTINSKDSYDIPIELHTTAKDVIEALKSKSMYKNDPFANFY